MDDKKQDYLKRMTGIDPAAQDPNGCYAAVSVAMEPIFFALGGWSAYFAPAAPDYVFARPGRISLFADTAYAAYMGYAQ